MRDLCETWYVKCALTSLWENLHLRLSLSSNKSYVTSYINKKQAVASDELCFTSCRPTLCLRFQVLTAASMKFRIFWDEGPFNVTTRDYIPEDSKLHI
jgi:hypothetical protein